MKFLLVILFALIVAVIIYRAEVLAFWGRIKYGKGDLSGCLKLHRIAKKVGNLGSTSLMYYGYLLLRSGEVDMAYTNLNEALRKAKKPAVKNRVKGMLALAVWKGGDLDGAIETMEELIADFKTTNFYQNLGVMYIVKGDGKKALEFCLEAYEYNSDDMIILDNLAESYALCGQLDKARETYEMLMEKEPYFPEAFYGYGLLLVRTGEKEKGVELIKQSLKKRFSFLSMKSKEEVERLLAEIEAE